MKIKKRLLVDSREPKNKSELEFYQFAKSNGWEISKRGWPDFIIAKYKEDDDVEFCCVEVKRKSNHNLKESQNSVMQLLSSYGIPCYKWTPELGLQKLEE